ncbi:DUF6475 domain-containing protein [Comamonas sp. MYb21]|uniref:DUF6475 domain-containing protein n=1 Tax=Comamonas sp. MYb21 TaxID=1848648 RepID=UPI0030A8948B
MQMSDRAAFAQLITDVLAYYRQDASRFVLELWWNACRGFELEQLRQAIQRHCTDAERGQFAPKVADLAKILQGTATDRAAIAWGKVHGAMSSVGAYQDVVFDDPAIHAVVDDLGGWQKVCRMPLDELGYLQHRFTESYRAYAGRGEFDYPRRLSGDRSPDSEYQKIGLKPPAPVVVGDRVAARQVYLQGSATGKTAISYQALDAIEAAPAGLLPASRPVVAA